MSSKSSVSHVEDLLTCSVCFFSYDCSLHKPKILPCHHTFCLKCLKSVSQSGATKCPVCSKVYRLSEEDIDRLPNNHYLSQFQDALDSFNISDSNKTMSRESSLSSSFCSSLYITKCTKHDTERRFWCDTCKELVCVHCLGVKHSPTQGHKIKEIDEAVEYYTKEINTTLQALERNILYVQNKKVQIMTEKNPSGSLLKQAVDCSLSTAAKSAEDVITDKTLDPTKAIENARKLLNSSENKSNLYKLDEAYKGLIETVPYMESLRKFAETKHEDATALKESRLMFSVVRPEIRFDYGRIYCIRCGTMCSVPEVKAADKNNSYGVPLVEHFCKNCGIITVELSS